MVGGYLELGLLIRILKIEAAFSQYPSITISLLIVVFLITTCNILPFSSII